MDQFPIPNRQRRRSNLGRRNRTNDNPPRPMPVFQVPAPRGLGRSVFSGKKTHPRPSASKPSVETQFAKKRLFLFSPQSLPSASKLRNEASNTSQYTHSNLPQQLSNVSLNETGVEALITTPSPKPEENSSFYHSWGKDYNKIERPKSLGMSHYNQLIFTELANLKPPVDPDDRGDVVKHSHSRNDPQKEEIGEELKLTSSFTKKEEINPCFPFVSNDELDTTDSFVLAEQTIIDQNQTVNETTQIRESLSVTKPILKPIKHLEPVEEEDGGSDSEDELLQQTISKLNTMMIELENTKKIVQSIVNKKKKRKTDLRNKENCAIAANKPIKDKWISELKSENPGLLKTPKRLKNHRLSIAEQSAIWTPHSLSTVLTDQMDDLFE